MKILELINPTNTVSFNRPLAHALGLSAAVVYSALIAKQAYYEQRDMLDREGFFFSTVADLQESTAMTKSQQASAIKILTEAGLLECCKRGIPAKRCFRVRDDTELLNSLLDLGRETMTALNPIAQKPSGTSPSGCAKTEPQVDSFSDSKSAENQPYTLNHNIKKSKEDNPYQSIQSADAIDTIEYSPHIGSSVERSNYHELICENIEYEGFTEEEKTKVDELVDIMLDAVCSTRPFIRVHCEELPQEVVKSRFLKIGHEHIRYVLLALQRNTTGVKNIRAYLTTALYNAPSSMEAFYTAMFNHDMHGGK